MTRLVASARGIGASPALSGAELGRVPDRRAADLPRAAPAARRFALVLSGGGARGAYEAGVLRYLLDRLPERLGRPVRFQIITGTSVGAVHACYVAATLGRAAVGRHLAEIWLSLDLARTYQVGLRDLVTLPRRLLGLGRPGAAALDGGWERLRGLLETLPLERLVRESIPWQELRRRVDGGDVEAVAVAATEIGSGRSVVFVDNREHVVRRWARDPFVVACPAALGPQHALASAAIPFLFPAPRIEGAYYCDGGLRLNTPLAPALRLGADRLLVVGLRHVASPAEDVALAARREASYGSLTYLAGKVLNALLLDHIDYDLDRLRLVNAILDTGAQAYGPDFLRRINTAIEGLRGTPYKVVRNVYLSPSRDLGTLAVECLRHHRRHRRRRTWLSDAIVRRAAQSVAGEGDLLSYLYFDGCYARHLIELGHADAEAHADDLMAFFSDEQSNSQITMQGGDAHDG